MAFNPKRKCRGYLVDYIKFGFVPCLSNIQLPMCLLCNKILSNEAMKPSRLKDHLTRLHPDKANKSIAFFQALKERQTQSSISKLFAKNTCQNIKRLIDSFHGREKEFTVQRWKKFGGTCSKRNYFHCNEKRPRTCTTNCSTEWYNSKTTNRRNGY